MGRSTRNLVLKSTAVYGYKVLQHFNVAHCGHWSKDKAVKQSRRISLKRRGQFSEEVLLMRHIKHNQQVKQVLKMGLICARTREGPRFDRENCPMDRLVELSEKISVYGEFFLNCFKKLLLENSTLELLNSRLDQYLTVFDEGKAAIMPQEEDFLVNMLSLLKHIRHLIVSVLIHFTARLIAFFFV